MNSVTRMVERGLCTTALLAILLGATAKWAAGQPPRQPGNSRPQAVIGQPNQRTARPAIRSRGILTHVPSTAGGEEGIAVSVIPPKKPRYEAGAPDHPHIRIQANAFQEAGARFVRVNPDRAYVRWLIGESRPGLVDNEAGTLYTPKTIRAALCPNEAAHRILQVAAMCELADRIQAGNFQPNLDRVLFPDAPKAAGPSPRGDPQPPRGQRRVTPPLRQGDNK